MRFYPIYEQTDQKNVEDFIRSQASCRIITMTSDKKTHYGIFNHFFDGQSFILHLNRLDEQVHDLKSNPNALVVFEEFLSVIPSYWVDENYAGAATSYYRYAEFDCQAEVSDTPELLRDALQKMMDHYQPEGQYVPLDPGSSLYKKSFDALVIIRLTPTSSRTKWKLGQNRPEASRRQVAKRLRERGTPNDLRAAQEVEASIESTQK